jgi:branched-chain amino acid transport system permease protein
LRALRGKRIEQVSFPVKLVTEIVLIQRLTGILALIVLMLTLAACGEALDPDQVRTCRQTLPAISLEASKITVSRVGPADPLHGVRIDYRTIENGREHYHFVICTFGPSPKDNSVIELNGLATEDGVYSPIRLHILRRYWLDRQDLSGQADPGPGDTAAKIPEVSPSLAYLIQAFSNGVPNTAMMMLIAVAYALVYGLVGRINFTFGDFAAIGGFATISGITFTAAAGAGSFALGFVFAAFLAIGVAMLCGRFVEHFVFSPLAFRRGQSILIATVGVSIILQEAMRLTEPSQMRWAPPVLNMTVPLVRGGAFIAQITPMQALIGALAPVIALAIVQSMRRTDFGRRWRAISDDALMANLMGISSRRMLAQTFALASALTGLAGFIMVARFGTVDASVGNMIGLKGLVAAVIGGIGSIEGALLGGLALGVFEMLWQAYLPIEHRDVAVMVLMVVMLIFRPGGLFGFGEAGPRQV